MAEVDFLLKIDGIEGESKVDKHQGAIQLKSWSWGATNSGTFAAGGGGGAGKVSMQDFQFTMQVNKATPKLIRACASGEHIKKAVLTCRKGGKNPQDYLKITFSDLLVSSYQTGSDDGDLIPEEHISFNFARIEYEYHEQKQDGTLGGALKAGYDLKRSKAI